VNLRAQHSARPQAEHLPGHLRASVRGVRPSRRRPAVDV